MAIPVAFTFLMQNVHHDGAELCIRNEFKNCSIHFGAKNYANTASIGIGMPNFHEVLYFYIHLGVTLFNFFNNQYIDLFKNPFLCI